LAAAEYGPEFGHTAGFVQFWHINNGKHIRNLSIQDATCIAYSPDGEILAMGSEDGVVHLWRTADGELLNALLGHTV
jgi:WD40 repeat protein